MAVPCVAWLGPAAVAVPAQDGIERFGFMHDAAGGPRDPPSCIADASATASSQGVKAAGGSPDATGQFAPASLRRTLPTGHRCHLPPTHGMYAASRQGRVVNPVDIQDFPWTPSPDKTASPSRTSRSRISRARKRCASPPPSCSTAGPSPKPATTDTAARRSCARCKARPRCWPRPRNSPRACRRHRSTSNAKTTSRFSST